MKWVYFFTVELYLCLYLDDDVNFVSSAGYEPNVRLERLLHQPV